MQELPDEEEKVKKKGILEEEEVQMQRPATGNLRGRRENKEKRHPWGRRGSADEASTAPAST
jgi:hypothetical protein